MKTPKLGKAGALKRATKKITELRKKPIPKSVFEIVEENAESQIRRKKVAKSRGDLEI